MKPMLAQDYMETNPKGYWISEKFDGVRAIWDGSDFISRAGNIFPAPAVLKSSMPAGVSLDGELFCGRGCFQKTVSKVRSGDWDGMMFMVFDLVTAGGFEDRQEILRAIPLPAWCGIAAQTKCRNRKHLADTEREMIAAGGEGLMLRAPGSPYVHGRSRNLLKIKYGKTDEAVVVGHRKGALVASLGGKSFGISLPSTDRRNPPSIGALVTIFFFGLTDAGKPRSPVLVGVRDYE